MPFCPDCECEYSPRMEKCPICATSLVEALYEKSTWVCDECKEEVLSDTPACPACGTIFKDDLLCFAHPDSSAHGRCVVCEQHMCLDCGILRLGRYYCELHGVEEEPMVEDENLYRAEDREAMTYRRYLAEEGVESKIFVTNKDTGRVFGQNTIEVASIIVSEKYREPALNCMKSHSIREGQVLFQCECCSALNRFDNDKCTNCGKH